MRTLISRIFYLLILAAFIYLFYNASLAVNSLFQKSSEASEQIYSESYNSIYIAAAGILAAFIFYFIARKIGKKF